MIAQGRCNHVFEAFEIALRRKVAIKQLNDGASEQEAALFWREARFLAAQGHHNIVGLHGIDEDRGWIITERMSGNLESRVAQGPMDPDLVRAVLRQALEGLTHFHQQGKIHGEIKPGNLLVDQDGYIKLNASPGFAASGEFRTPLGCQRHVAPELLNPRTFGVPGIAVDLYCLGFTMLELLVGPGIENHFKGIGGKGKQRDLAWLRWHNSHTEVLPSLRHLVPDAPDDLVAVIDRLVAKKVSMRFQRTEEALQALENAPLLRVPSEDEASEKARSRRAAGAVVKGKPPVHQEYAELQEKSKTLTYRLTHSLPYQRLEGYLKNPVVRRSLLLGVALVAVLLLIIPSGPRARTVQIESEPTGAIVIIDGVATGRETPLTWSLGVGERRLEFMLPGYEPGQLIAHVPVEGDAGPYRCDLEPTTPSDPAGTPGERPETIPPREYFVSISSVPPGAEILLDGSPVVVSGMSEPLRTPSKLNLGLGDHLLELRADGYVPRQEKIRVTQFANEFEFELTPVEIPEATTPPKNSEVEGPVSPTPPIDETQEKPTVDQPKRIVKTPDTPIFTDWDVPDYVLPARRSEYFQQIRLIVGDSWQEPRSRTQEIASAAYARARLIHRADPRMHFACAILLEKHLETEAAIDQLEKAKEYELDRQRRLERQRPEGDATRHDPFPAPWRQLTRIYLAQREWDLAIAECLALVRYCATVQQNSSGPEFGHRQDGSKFLDENIRFAGHSFGYMKFERSRIANTRVQPFDRFEILLEARLDDDSVRLFRDSIHEAWAHCQKFSGNEDPILRQLQGDGLRGMSGGPLQDLLPSLEWERQLLLEAIDNAIARSDAPADSSQTAKGHLPSGPLQKRDLPDSDAKCAATQGGRLLGALVGKFLPDFQGSADGGSREVDEVSPTMSGPEAVQVNRGEVEATKESVGDSLPPELPREGIFPAEASY
ncbi:MAG: PEGA domain-containing protein [Planctomycetaceae bacterium]|nr:PEGA domain-containing protein [Planctomycetaceae bacterium]